MLNSIATPKMLMWWRIIARSGLNAKTATLSNRTGRSMPANMYEHKEARHVKRAGLND